MDLLTGINKPREKSTSPKPEDIAKRGKCIKILRKQHKTEGRYQLKETKTAQQQSLPIIRFIELDELTKLNQISESRRS